MSIVTLPASAPTTQQPVPAETPDAEFERRWTAWKTRGLAHDRAVRQRLVIAATVTAVVAVAALAMYGSTFM